MPSDPQTNCSLSSQLQDYWFLHSPTESTKTPLQSAQQELTYVLPSLAHTGWYSPEHDSQLTHSPK